MMLVGFQHSDALDEVIEFAGNMKLVGGEFSNGFLHVFHIDFGAGSFAHGNSVQ